LPLRRAWKKVSPPSGDRCDSSVARVVAKTRPPTFNVTISAISEGEGEEEMVVVVEEEEREGEELEELELDVGEMESPLMNLPTTYVNPSSFMKHSEHTGPQNCEEDRECLWPASRGTRRDKCRARRQPMHTDSTIEADQPTHAHNIHKENKSLIYN